MPNAPAVTISEPAAEDARRFHANLELLAEMSRDFAASRDLDVTLLKAVGHITDSVDAEGGALFLLDEAQENLRCHACVGATEITGLVIAADKGIVGRVVQNNLGEIVRDVSKDPSFFGGVDEKTGYTTKSILCAPLTVKDERIGAIELINKRGGDGLFSPGDLHFLEALAASAALAILNARQADALLEQERIKRELELAREIQSSLLPRAGDADAPIAGVNLPAREVSGDFFDHFPLKDGRICFCLGDVSGKGMNAALLMAKTASLYRCLGKAILSPGRLLGLVNREICETAARGMFVTMVAGIYDPRTGVVTLSNAGHEPPLVLTSDGGFEAFEAGGPPLGILADPPTKEGYPEAAIELKGGSLWVFTDGVTEGYVDDAGTELGAEGVRGILLETRGRALKDRLDAVVGVLKPGESGMRDDVTLLGLVDTAAGRPTTTSSPATGAESIMSMRLPAKADRLRVIRHAVRAALDYLDCEHEMTEQVILAVDEACQNVVRHAYGGRADGEIAVELRRDGGDFVVELQDFAAPVDVGAIRGRDLDDIRPGGLGVHLIREIMDDVQFVTPPAGVGNLLQLRKRLYTKAGAS
ncbi:MAG: serine/threonine protein phosphatase [Rhodospirillales bacterium CG15_BIG_FIL_POST_REV_8_21_14_020_66_15]|nr:MAG: serine/threonine protein phosphatase [Rhodospirillales bacterium CG15_BIG_FIL_POST_REV_8_21_14_020_66_15]